MNAPDYEVLGRIESAKSRLDIADRALMDSHEAGIVTLMDADDLRTRLMGIVKVLEQAIEDLKGQTE